MIDKILEIFGLVRISNVRDLNLEPYSDDELDVMYINTAYRRSEGWDKEKYEHMLDLLKRNPQFAQFLDWTIAEDVKRSFNVTEQERSVVRGAVSRTRYLRSLCLNQSDLKKEMSGKITRYAK